MTAKKAEKKFPCRVCDDATNYGTCDNCGWAVCGRHAKKRESSSSGRKFVVCAQCAEQGF
jgi:uncharacterized UBP type Zn finger protein